ncbi:MAG: Ig-like domain-containing protein [Gemmatimonadaceae bacterium]
MTVRRPLHAHVCALVALSVLVACSDTKQLTTSLDPSLVAANASEMGVTSRAVIGIQNQVGQLKVGLKWYPTWVSRDTTVVDVTSTGVATGVRVGSAYAVATNAFQKRDSLLITVNPGTPTTVNVVLPKPTLSPSQTMQATAVAIDANGKTLVGAPIQWSTSNAAVATVSASGVVTAVAAGTVAIGATSSGLSASAVMTVQGTPPPVSSITVAMSPTTLNVGQKVQATAVARDAQGNVLPGVSFTWGVSVTSILSASSSGMITGVSAGTAQVQATASGVTGSLSATVTSSQPPPVPGPNGLTVPPALPQVLLNFPYVPGTGKTIFVAAGANLQTAINSANRGDEVVLQAGATFSGNFILPAKPGNASNGWVVIRGDHYNLLPPEGTRVTSALASTMPMVMTPNATAAIATAPGASGYRLIGLEVTTPATYSGPQYGLIWLGDGSSAQNQLSQVPTDLVLDRMYIHGSTNSDVQRCVGLNSARSQVSDSYLKDCHGSGVDAQAIAGWNGPGPFKIVNNTLEGSTENIMFGGADPAIPNLIPSDIEIRRNYVVTPASWKGKAWVKKNLMELKVGRRILIEGNVFDGSWQNGQTGWALFLKSENQSGRCTWCTTSDVTIRYNYIRNAGAGIAIVGKEGTSPYPVGALSARFSVQNNLMDNINVGVYVGDDRLMEVLGNAQDVEFVNNTFTSTGFLAQFMAFDQYNTATRFAFNYNVVSLAQYGLFATARGEGTPALAAVVGGWQFNSNWLLGASRASIYPATTSFVPSVPSVPAGFGADQATVNAKIAGVIIP